MKLTSVMGGMMLSVGILSGPAQGAPVSDAEADYRATESSVTNLLAFIAAHPRDPGWCGEAKIMIAHRQFQSGERDGALASCREAISLYGTNQAPDRNIFITVTDIANSHMASYLDSMGRRDAALRAARDIANESIRRDALMRLQKKKEQDRTSGSSDPPQSSGR